MKTRRAGILTIGNEVLYGQTVDGNAAFLGRELQALGFDVPWRRTVGDRVPDIMEAVDSGLSSCDILMATGGLGPTSDDVTRQATARLFRSKLVLDKSLLEGIRSRFARRGLRMPACNRVQAMVPSGAEILPNPQGTAPGLVFRRGGRMAALLPGVPREMEAIWNGSLRPMLAGTGGRGVAVVTLRTFGLPESAVADRLRHIEKTLPRGSMAYLPSLRGVDLRLTFHAASAGAAQNMAEAAAGRIGDKLGEAVYARGQETMEQVVGRLLSELKLSACTAESCTGGLIADRLTDVPGSSSYFLGGVVAYSNRLKTGLLGVKPDTLRRHGAVSRQTALEMAVGGRRRCGGDLCMAATGIAGPGGAVPGKPVGLAYLAVSGPYGNIVQVRRFTGGRRSVKEWAAQSCLDLARRYLSNRRQDGLPKGGR
jgi:nicotinamide-nucleotide amidase